jgi:hypothetical protein
VAVNSRQGLVSSMSSEPGRLELSYLLSWFLSCYAP